MLLGYSHAQCLSQYKQIIAIVFASWTMFNRVLRVYQRNQ